MEVLYSGAVAPFQKTQRVISLDYIRVIACFMVILVHTCEFYYLGDGIVVFVQQSDRLWVALIDSAMRQSVPLFVMISAFLLVPMKTDTSTFFKRRFTRIFWPFAFWSVMYAVIPVVFGSVDGSAAGRIVKIIYSFNDDSGHLWYIYMFIGVYLTIPVISPWLKQVSRRGEEAFLAIWFVSTFWNYLTPWLGDLWGKCAWNDFHMLYYFSGFIGYVVLAHYIKTYLKFDFKQALIVGLPVFAAGYAVTFWLFYDHTGISSDYAYAEQSWNFCTFNVAMMAFGCFVIFHNLNYRATRLNRHICTISQLSFGIYLMHIFFLNVVHAWIAPLLPTIAAIPVIGIVTFAVCCIVARLISFLPGARYIVG